MNEKMKWMAATLALSTSAAMASVALDFNVDSGYTGPTRLRVSSDIITYNFSVDGTGSVTLDASAASTDGNAVTTVTLATASA